MFTWLNMLRIVQQAHDNIMVALATVETLVITTAESLAGATAESVEMFADGNSPADWDYAADPFADSFADPFTDF